MNPLSSMEKLVRIFGSYGTRKGWGLPEFGLLCQNYTHLVADRGHLVGRDRARLHDFLATRSEEFKEAAVVAFTEGGPQALERFFDDATRGLRKRLWRQSRKRRGQ